MGAAPLRTTVARRSAVLVVLDGLGDRPSPDTDGKDPVAAASTPELDRLAEIGEVGTVSILGAGVAPESDAGVFALLGYDPVRDSPGRGVLEAMGVELPLRPGDVALRLNFATIEDDGRVVDSRVGRSLGTEESMALARALTAANLLQDRGIRAEVRSTVGHRGVLWLHPFSGGALSPNVSNADPFYEKVGGMGSARRPAEPRLESVAALDGSPEAARTAEALNVFLQRVRPVLAAQPANVARGHAGALQASGLLVRNAGALPATPPESFAHRYGVRGGAVTEMPVERGIARLLGLEDRFVGPMSGDRLAGYRDRAQATVELLETVPFVYVHLKGPDEPGHDGDARRKRAVIEEIDRGFFGAIAKELDLGSTTLAVTADHATPCVLRGHSDDPVPWLLVGAGVPPPSGRPSRKFGVLADPASAPLAASEVIPRLLSRPRSSPSR
jgi:2,3-bisphosphoglycerate-independent phosphoglycerate mutase